MYARDPNTGKHDQALLLLCLNAPKRRHKSDTETYLGQAKAAVLGEKRASPQSHANFRKIKEDDDANHVTPTTAATKNYGHHHPPRCIPGETKLYPRDETTTTCIYMYAPSSLARPQGARIKTRENIHWPVQTPERSHASNGNELFSSIFTRDRPVRRKKRPAKHYLTYPSSAQQQQSRRKATPATNSHPYTHNPTERKARHIPTSPCSGELSATLPTFTCTTHEIHTHTQNINPC